MSSDEKAKTREKDTISRKRLRDGMEKAKNMMNRLRDSMSPDEKAKIEGERKNCTEDIEGWHVLYFS
jgi:hypothetical protein